MQRTRVPFPRCLTQTERKAVNATLLTTRDDDDDGLRSRECSSSQKCLRVNDLERARGGENKVLL